MFSFDDRYSVPVVAGSKPFGVLKAAGVVEAIVPIVFLGHERSPQQRELSVCLSVNRPAEGEVSAMPPLYASKTS
jgi:hypothetical protein